MVFVLKLNNQQPSIKMNTKKTINSFLFKIEDYILYILNKLEPDKSDKIRLNKIAFFVEFAYLFYKEKPLSKAQYAAIDNGAVIDSYDLILKKMQQDKRIKLDGYIVRPLKSPDAQIPEELSLFIDPLIKKYSLLSNEELILLSHSTDSYKITTDNERVMGKIIDKKLAPLETFFCENEVVECKIDENKLPVVDKKKLIRYGIK